MHAAKSSLRSATALPERQPLSGFFDADPSLGLDVLVAWYYDARGDIELLTYSLVQSLQVAKTLATMKHD